MKFDFEAEDCCLITNGNSLAHPHSRKNESEEDVVLRLIQGNPHLIRCRRVGNWNPRIRIPEIIGVHHHLPLGVKDWQENRPALIKPLFHLGFNEKAVSHRTKRRCSACGTPAH
jgi:hypothetical protein